MQRGRGQWHSIAHRHPFFFTCRCRRGIVRPRESEWWSMACVCEWHPHDRAVVAQQREDGWNKTIIRSHWTTWQVSKWQSRRCGWPLVAEPHEVTVCLHSTSQWGPLKEVKLLKMLPLPSFLSWQCFSLFFITFFLFDFPDYSICFNFKKMRNNTIDWNNENR